ncbi:MAG: M50 family metallopeptidase [Bdellovibrionales bacterium]|nr:M50 family metallopeptidase [Bdellovibrionales bacterium]
MKKKSLRRHFSIAFLLAIPGNFVIAAVLLFSFLSLAQKYPLATERWTVFATGLFGGFVIVGTTKMPTMRVFIHELRHAVVVLLTGNRLKNFHVDTHSGHVTFQMASDRVHFAPFITLAPYCFPLFSLPTLLLCVTLEEFYPLLLTLLLGLVLATDLETAFEELHPHQTDLKQVMGGFFASALYIAGAHLAWIGTCLVWVVGGRSAYLYSGYVMLELVKSIAQRYAPYLAFS